MDKAQAKMEVLKELMEMCQDKMGDDVRSDMDAMKMKKVSVMAPNDEGLKEGLKVAENILPEENINPEVADLDTEEGTVVPGLEATEKLDSEADDEDDSIFGKRKRMSKMQKLTMMDEE